MTISPVAMVNALALRDIDADEEAVFFGLYAAVRSEELAMRDWDAQLRDQILRLQFDAQRRGYLGQFPAARERLILREGAPAGWVIVDGSGAVLRCVDIAVVPEERRKGIATHVMRALQEEAAADRRALALQVVRSNIPARALYDRLGFKAIDDTELHIHLEWRP